MSRTYFDITLPYSPRLPAWPGEPKPVIERLKNIGDGDHATVSRIDACVHYGTHLDAPMHFIHGQSGTETLPVDVLMGPTLVVAMPDADAVSSEHLEKQYIPDGTARILFKTRNSDLWNDLDHEFYKDFVAISPDGAQWLVDRGVKLVGVDYLSLETYHSTDFIVHKTILGAGIIAVEGLDLRNVAPGRYEMACLPMKIVDSDGAPARVVLWQDS